MNVLFSILLLAPFILGAQTSQQLPLDVQAQLQLQQQPVDVSPPENISATAEFDPPSVRAGEKTFYRVTVEATQNSIEWPAKFYAPPGLKFGAGARGQVARLDGNKFRPLTAFAYEVTATAAGRFVVSNFVVLAGGQRVEIPAATLEVVETNAPPLPAARRLALEVLETNLFLGQPFHVRVLLPSARGNQLEALREIQFNGDGFMTDKTVTRQSITSMSRDGQLRNTFIYETVAAPIATGPLKLTAQGFTAAPFSVGPISISSSGGPINLSGTAQEPVFLVSDPLPLSVRPIPLENALPGFTGALGRFTAEKLLLATNRLRVGEPVHLKFGYQDDGNLTRFVPPQAPRSREWQIIADNPPGNGFTLIPLTDEATNTPSIPFCAFDPTAGSFYDLTIPAQPVTVIGEGLPTQLPSADNADKASPTPKMSGLTASPGKTAASLKPLQVQGWFVVVQFLPVAGLFALWRWDERRRFLEAHPEIVRRRRALRDLRRENIKLRQAFAANDAERFVQHAAAAMRIAVAPHFPADARALVGGDVLLQLDETERNGRAGKMVRDIFAAADAQFAARTETHADLLALQSGVASVLKQLEEKL